MRRLIDLCRRIEEAETSFVDREVLIAKNSFSEVELKANESSTTHVGKSSVELGILYCMEEFVDYGKNLKQFYEHCGT